MDQFISSGNGRVTTSSNVVLRSREETLYYGNVEESEIIDITFNDIEDEAHQDNPSTSEEPQYFKNLFSELPTKHTSSGKRKLDSPPRQWEEKRSKIEQDSNVDTESWENEEVVFNYMTGTYEPRKKSVELGMGEVINTNPKNELLEDISIEKGHLVEEEDIIFVGSLQNSSVSPNIAKIPVILDVTAPSNLPVSPTNPPIIPCSDFKDSIDSLVPSSPIHIDESSTDIIIIPEDSSEIISSSVVETSRFILKDLVVRLTPLSTSSLKEMMNENIDSDQSWSSDAESEPKNTEELYSVKKRSRLPHTVCRTCGYSAKTQKNLILHINKAHLQIKCKSCGFECETSRKMEQHELTHAVTISEQDSALNVISSVNKTIDISLENNNIPDCTQSLTENIESEDDEPSETRSNRFQCFFCKFRTSKQKFLNWHVGRHNGKKYFCDDHFWREAEVACRKCIFENIMSNLSRSLLTCKNCGYSTTRPHYFKIHASLPFSCSQYILKEKNKKKRDCSADQNENSLVIDLKDVELSENSLEQQGKGKVPSGPREPENSKSSLQSQEDSSIAVEDQVSLNLSEDHKNTISGLEVRRIASENSLEQQGKEKVPSGPREPENSKSSLQSQEDSSIAVEDQVSLNLSEDHKNTISGLEVRRIASENSLEQQGKEKVPSGPREPENSKSSLQSQEDSSIAVEDQVSLNLSEDHKNTISGLEVRRIASENSLEQQGKEKVPSGPREPENSKSSLQSQEDSSIAVEDQVSLNLSEDHKNTISGLEVRRIASENSLEQQGKEKVPSGPREPENSKSSLQSQEDSSKAVEDQVSLNLSQDHENTISGSEVRKTASQNSLEQQGKDKVPSDSREPENSKASVQSREDPSKVVEDEVFLNLGQDHENTTSGSEVRKTAVLSKENEVQSSTDSIETSVSTVENLNDNNSQPQEQACTDNSSNLSLREDQSKAIKDGSSLNLTENRANTISNSEVMETGGKTSENEIHSSADSFATVKTSISLDNIAIGEESDGPEEKYTSITFKCFDCDSPISKKDELNSHASSCHPSSSFKCDIHKTKDNFHECAKCVYELIFKTSVTAIEPADDPFEVDMTWIFNSGERDAHVEGTGKNEQQLAVYNEPRCGKRGYSDVDSDTDFEVDIDQTKVYTTRSKMSKNEDVAKNVGKESDLDDNKPLTRSVTKKTKQTEKCDCNYSRMYDDLEGFKNHVSRHMGSKYQCTEHRNEYRADCMKCFYEVLLQELKKDLKSCKTCGFSTYFMHNLKRHLRGKVSCKLWKKSPKLLQGEMICFACQYRTMHKDHLKYHMVDHLDVEFSCKEHVKTENECLECVYAKCLEDAKNEVVICKTCQFRTVIKKEFGEHTCTETPSELCNKKQTVSDDTLRENSKLLKRYKCFDCDGFASQTMAKHKIHTRLCKYQEDISSCDRMGVSNGQNIVVNTLTNNDPLSQTSHTGENTETCTINCENIDSISVVSLERTENQIEVNTETAVPALELTQINTENIKPQSVVSPEGPENHLGVSITETAVPALELTQINTENIKPRSDVSLEGPENHLRVSITETAVPALEGTQINTENIIPHSDVSLEGPVNHLGVSISETAIPALERTQINTENIIPHSDVSLEGPENHLGGSNTETAIPALERTQINTENIIPHSDVSLEGPENHLGVSNTETAVPVLEGTQVNTENIIPHSDVSLEGPENHLGVSNTETAVPVLEGTQINTENIIPRSDVSLEGPENHLGVSNTETAIPALERTQINTENIIPRSDVSLEGPENHLGVSNTETAIPALERTQINTENIIPHSDVSLEGPENHLGVSNTETAVPVLEGTQVNTENIIPRSDVSLEGPENHLGVSNTETAIPALERTQINTENIIPHSDVSLEGPENHLGVSNTETAVPVLEGTQVNTENIIPRSDVSLEGPENHLGVSNTETAIPALERTQINTENIIPHSDVSLEGPENHLGVSNTETAVPVLEGTQVNTENIIPRSDVSLEGPENHLGVSNTETAIPALERTQINTENIIPHSDVSLEGPENHLGVSNTETAVPVLEGTQVNTENIIPRSDVSLEGPENHLGVSITETAVPALELTQINTENIKPRSDVSLEGPVNHLGVSNTETAIPPFEGTQINTENIEPWSDVSLKVREIDLGVSNTESAVSALAGTLINTENIDSQLNKREKVEISSESHNIQVENTNERNPGTCAEGTGSQSVHVKSDKDEIAVLNCSLLKINTENIKPPLYNQQNAQVSYTSNENTVEDCLDTARKEVMICEKCSFKTADKQMFDKHNCEQRVGISSEEGADHRSKEIFNTGGDASRIGKVVDIGQLQSQKEIDNGHKTDEINVQPTKEANSKKLDIDTTLTAYCLECNYSCSAKGYGLNMHVCRHIGSKFQCVQHPFKQNNCHKCMYENALQYASKFCKSCRCGYKTSNNFKLTRHIKNKVCWKWINRPMIKDEMQCLVCRYVTIHKKFLKYHMVDHLGETLTCDKQHSDENEKCQRCLNEECLESAKREVMICEKCNFKSVIKYVFDTHPCRRITTEENTEHSSDIANIGSRGKTDGSKSTDKKKVSKSKRKGETGVEPQVEVRCFDCKYSSWETHNLFKKHFCSHIGSKYQCIEHWKIKVDNCPKCIYEVLLQKLQKEVKVCNNCGYKALDELTLSRHKKKLHFCDKWANRKLQPDEIRCLKCQYVTSHRKFLKYHMVDHLGLTYACDEHKENKDEKCNKCIYEKCLREVKDEVRTCEKCDFKTVIKQVFKLHDCQSLATTIIGNVAGVSETQNEPEGVHCFDCKTPREFNKLKFMKHVSRHIGSKFQCLGHDKVKRDDCKKCFYETSLKTASDTAKSCEKCGYRTADSYSLLRHKNGTDSCNLWSRRKSRTSELRCLKCQYVTSHRKFLKYHMIDHLDQTICCEIHLKNDNEACQTCSNARCLEGAKREVQTCKKCSFKTAIKQVFDIHSCEGKKAVQDPKQTVSTEEKLDSTKDNRGKMEKKVEKIKKKKTKNTDKKDNDTVAGSKTPAKCFDCKLFSSDNDKTFKKHVCSHVGSKFQCIEHRKGKVADCLKCHYEKVLQELEKKVKTCNICGFKALDEAGLTKHLKEFGSCSRWSNRNLRPEEVRCLQCQYTTGFKKCLKYHMVDHLDLTFACDLHTDGKDETCEKCIYELCLENAKKEVKTCETCQFKTVIKQIFDIHDCKPTKTKEAGAGSNEATASNGGTSVADDQNFKENASKVRCFDCRYACCADKQYAFRKHVCRHIGSKFQCMEHVQLKSAECLKCYYQEVVTSFDKDLKVCNTCGYKSISQSRMTRHRDGNDACKLWVERKLKPGEVKCFQCQYVTTHKRFLKYHMVDHLDVEFACKIDHKNAKDKECSQCIYEDCLKSAKKEAIVCEKCNFKTLIGKVMKIHASKEHVITQKEESITSKSYTIECESCHFTTRLIHEFKNHDCDKNRDDVPDESYTDDASKTDLFNCYHCHYRGNMSGLQNHAIRHYGQPFKCYEHRKEHYNGIRENGCQKCNYEYLLKRYQTILKICVKCQYRTLSELQFDEHAKGCSRTVTEADAVGNHKLILKCFDCGITYHSEHGLKGHAIQHFDSTFKCDEHRDGINHDCPKCIYQDIVKNIENNSYTCSDCGFKAYRWNVLKNHEKSKVNCQIYITKLIAEGRNVEKPRIITYRCFDCDFSHERKDFFEKHIMTHERSAFQCDVHQEQSKECPKCIYRELLNKMSRQSLCLDCTPHGMFATRFGLKRHIIHTHKDSYFVCTKHNNKWDNCSACIYELMVKQTFQRAYRLVCYDCNETPVFDKEKKLKDHVIECHLRSEFVCDVHLLNSELNTCNKCYYEELIRICDSEVISSDNVASTSQELLQVYRCFDCAYQTSVDTGLSFHIRRKHLESDFSCSDHNLGDIDETSCAMCRYESVLMQCKQSLSVKCSKCNFETLKQDDLDKHYNQKHGKETFMNTAIISEDFHKKRPRMLQCFDCKSYITNSRDNLFKHLCTVSHAKYRTNEYTCDKHRMYDNTCEKCIFARLRKNARERNKKGGKTENDKNAN